jgi:uncharacterized protein involved in exopolysaccharide biosynthesis
MDMDTEVAILQSDLLALQVIKTLNLDKMPGFGGRPSNSESVVSSASTFFQTDPNLSSSLREYESEL